MAISAKMYSLLEYTVNVKFKNINNAVSIPIGGKGSYVGNISISKESPNITKHVDSTGSGVFSYSANNSGTLTVELNYLSVKVQEILNRIISRYYITDNDGSSQAWKSTLLDIEIFKNNTKVLEATSCMLEGAPDLVLGPEVATRSFVFQCIEIKEHTEVTSFETPIGVE